MSFRTVVITNQCKLSYKDQFLLIRGEDMKMIHLSEIDTLVLDTTMVSVTAYLLCELMKRKINVIFCDERHHPYGEVLPLYGSHNTSKKVQWQMEWEQGIKVQCWTRILQEKIRRQAELLEHFELSDSDALQTFAHGVMMGDASNREGHAAKVYFHALFGTEFHREEVNPINGALDYGYAVLLSLVTREVVANGYITQVGIGHKNEFNHYNLSSDLLEPLRGIVDRHVYGLDMEEVTKTVRLGLIDLLNLEVGYEGRQYYLSHAVRLYVKNTLQCITTKELDGLSFVEWL